MRARAIDPLIVLGTYDNDVVKTYAIATLDLLKINNAHAYQQIVEKGGLRLLEGLKQFGAPVAARDACSPAAMPVLCFVAGLGEMRGIVSEQIDGLQQPPEVQALVDAGGHARQAKQQRIKHSKLWDSMGLQRAYAPQPQ